VFIAASFKIAKIGKQPKYLSVDAMRYYSHPPKKKSVSCHLDNMHGSRGYFANERNQTEKYKLNDPIYMRNLKNKTKFVKIY